MKVWMIYCYYSNRLFSLGWGFFQGFKPNLGDTQAGWRRGWMNPENFSEQAPAAKKHHLVLQVTLPETKILAPEN